MRQHLPAHKYLRLQYHIGHVVNGIVEDMKKGQLKDVLTSIRSPVINYKEGKGLQNGGNCMSKTFCTPCQGVKIVVPLTFKRVETLCAPPFWLQHG